MLWCFVIIVLWSETVHVYDVYLANPYSNFQVTEKKAIEMRETLNNSIGVRITKFISGVFYAAAAACIACAIVTAALLTYAARVYSTLPDIGDIKNMSAPGSIALAYSEMPVFLSKAIVHAFDPGYFSHKGITADNLKRCVMKIYNGGEAGFEERTLTQNLAAAVLSARGQAAGGKLYDRAAALLKESLLAFKMESKIRSKDKILEIYLNNVSFGSGINGILQASVVFFNKKPADLTEAECLTLASILKLKPNLNAESGVREMVAEREKIIGAIVEKGLIGREKAANYKFEDFRLNSYRSRIDSIVLNGFLL